MLLLLTFLKKYWYAILTNQMMTWFQAKCHRQSLTTVTIACLWQQLQSHVSDNSYNRMSLTTVTIACLWQQLQSRVSDNSYNRMSLTTVTIACLWQQLQSHVCDRTFESMSKQVVVVFKSVQLSYLKSANGRLSMLAFGTDANTLLLWNCSYN